MAHLAKDHLVDYFISKTAHLCRCGMSHSSYPQLVASMIHGRKLLMLLESSDGDHEMMIQ